MKVSYLCNATDKITKELLGDIFKVEIDEDYQTESNAKNIAIDIFDDLHPQYKNRNYYMDTVKE
jgi:ribosomal protein L31